MARLQDRSSPARDAAGRWWLEHELTERSQRNQQPLDLGASKGRSITMPAQVIDADGHVIEPEEMFAAIDPDFCKRRPIAVTIPPDTEWGPSDKVWLVEGKIMPNIGGRGPTGRTTFFLPGSKLA